MAVSCLLCLGVETPALAHRRHWAHTQLRTRQGGSRTRGDVAPGPHRGCTELSCPGEIRSFPHFCLPGRLRDWQGLAQVLKCHPDMATGSLPASAEPTGSRSAQPPAQLLRETPPAGLPAGTLTWVRRPLRAGSHLVAFMPHLSSRLVSTLLGQMMDTQALPHPPRFSGPSPEGRTSKPPLPLVLAVPQWRGCGGPGSEVLGPAQLTQPFPGLVLSPCGWFGRPDALAGCAPADQGASTPAFSPVCPFCT